MVSMKAICCDLAELHTVAVGVSALMLIGSFWSSLG